MFAEFLLDRSSLSMTKKRDRRRRSFLRRRVDRRDRADRLFGLETEKNCHFAGRIEFDRRFARHPNRPSSRRDDGRTTDDGNGVCTVRCRQKRPRDTLQGTISTQTRTHAKCSLPFRAQCDRKL